MNNIMTNDLAILFCALSALSGLGSYLQGVRSKRITHGCLNFTTEVVTALIAGMIVAFAGHSFEVNEALTCAVVLVMSNNGADTVAYGKKVIKHIINQRVGMTNQNNNGA